MPKQRILLTGATSGLGAGAALGLAHKHHVTVGGETWQQVTAFRERADQAGVKLEVIKLDLLNEVDLRHAAELEVDTLVLNAAVQEDGSIVDVPMDLIRRSFEINVFAHLDLARRIVPRLMKKMRAGCLAPANVHWQYCRSIVKCTVTTIGTPIRRARYCPIG